MTYKKLRSLYSNKGKSVSQISKVLNCSETKINYWLKKYNIPKRSIADAIYLKHNPSGDPFKIYFPKNIAEAIQYGIGIGLYWGEGTKANRHSVRLGNTNPRIIKNFIEFLIVFFRIRKEKLKFGLQVFNDVDSQKAFEFWKKYLALKETQFQKIVVSQVRGNGNYKNKSEYGVITIYFNNKKLRDNICGIIEKL